MFGNGLGAARRLAAAAIGLCLCGFLPAMAGPVADGAAEAETLMSAGKAEDALGAFDKAAAAFWVSSPLQLRKAIFADSIGGFGD